MGGALCNLSTLVFVAGNAGCTLIVKPLAQILGLVDALGRPTEAYSRSVKVQGVVAGASETIRTVTLTYQLKGKPCVCAVRVGIY